MPSIEGVLFDKGGAVFNPMNASAPDTPLNAADLQDYIDQVASDGGGEVIISRWYTIATANSFELLVPQNVAIRVVKGGGFDLTTTNRNVRFLGTFEAGAYQVFKGQGYVFFGPGSVSAVIPQWWGARGDGSSAQSEVARALRSIKAAGGGTLFFPPGTYLLSGVGELDIPSRTTLRGAGAYRSILKWADSSSGRYGNLFEIGGEERAQNIVIESLGIDFNHTSTASTMAAISLLDHGVEDLRVRDCRFFDSVTVVPENQVAITDIPDRWAVSLDSETPWEDVWIEDCVADHFIQLTANGGAGGRGLWICRNRVTDAEENAIAIPFTAGTANVGLEDVWILDNVLINTHAFGIYLGADVDDFGDDKFISRVTIRGNRLIGFSGPDTPHVGIFIKAVKQGTSSITIEDNEIVGDLGSSDTAIIMRDQSHYGNVTFDRVRIANNRIVHCRNPAELLFLNGFSIEGNEFTGSAGMLVSNCRNGVVSRNRHTDGKMAMHITQSTHVTVAENLVSGAAESGVSLVGGIVVTDSTGVRVADNRVRNTANLSGGQAAGIIFVTSTSAATLQADSEGNQATDDRPAGSKTQHYGVKYVGSGTFATRHFREDVRGNALRGAHDVTSPMSFSDGSDLYGYNVTPRGVWVKDYTLTQAITVQPGETWSRIFDNFHGVGPVGTFAMASHSLLPGENWEISARIHELYKVNVMVTNHDTVQRTIPAGTLRVCVLVA